MCLSLHGSWYHVHYPELGPIDNGLSGGKPLEPLNGLYGYSEKVKVGHILVFNLDEMLCVDLFEENNVLTSLLKESDRSGGLQGFDEALKSGKALIFDLEAMKCLDLFTGGANPF